MNLEELRNYCLSKKGATEDLPFDETTLCFRVGNKIFAITDLEDYPVEVNLKCKPDKAIELREHYESIRPGFHMNKKHWNTVTLAEDITESLLEEMIDDSYNLILNSLSKKVRNSI